MGLVWVIAKNGYYLPISQASTLALMKPSCLVENFTQSSPNKEAKGRKGYLVTMIKGVGSDKVSKILK